MRIIKVTEGSLILDKFLLSGDLVLECNIPSKYILPNPQMLTRLIRYQDHIRLILDSSLELAMLSEVNPNVSDILYVEPKIEDKDE